LHTERSIIIFHTIRAINVECYVFPTHCAIFFSIYDTALLSYGKKIGSQALRSIYNLNIGSGSGFPSNATLV
jgi:hypothetical protein